MGPLSLFFLSSHPKRYKAGPYNKCSPYLYKYLILIVEWSVLFAVICFLLSLIYTLGLPASQPLLHALQALHAIHQPSHPETRIRV